MDLFNKVDSSGLVVHGAHANGHISVYMQSAGQWTIQHQLDPHFPMGHPSDAGRVADVLRVACNKIKELPTDGHNPWLRAEWQLRFQAICEAIAQGLYWLA